MRIRKTTQADGAAHLARGEPGMLLGLLGGRFPAANFVVGYLFLLLCVPSELIFQPLGAAGTPANLWALLGLLWWVLAAFHRSTPVTGLTPLRLGLGFAVVGVLASYCAGFAAGRYAAVDVRQSTDELWTLLPVSPLDLADKLANAADRGLITFAGFVGIALIAGEGLRTRADLEVVVTWLVRFAAFVAFLGIIQFYFGIDIAGLYRIPLLSANADFGEVISRSVLNRVSGTAVHPIEFGVVMAGVFWIALTRALARKGWSWVPVVLIGFAIPISVSRSAILAAGVAGVLVLIGWPPRWRRNALLTLPFVAIGVRVLAPGLVGTLVSLFGNLNADPSVSGRTADYAVAARLLDEEPILGRGLFTLVPRYYRIFDNQILITVIELGIIGALMFGVVFLAAILEGNSARRRLRDSPDRYLALAVTSALIGILFSYLTFDALGFPMVGGLTFLLIGLAGALGQRARATARDERVGRQTTIEGAGRAVT